MGRGSNEARLAFAVITAPRVAADRRRPARVRKTLVHVHALGSDRFEPVLAEASPLDALGVVHAIEVRLAERGHVGLKIELVKVELQTRGENKIIKLIKIVHLLASNSRIWIGSVSRWTDAVVTGILVLANRVSPAGALQRRALVDVWETISYFELTTIERKSIDEEKYTSKILSLRGRRTRVILIFENRLAEKIILYIKKKR